MCVCVTQTTTTNFEFFVSSAGAVDWNSPFHLCICRGWSFSRFSRCIQHSFLLFGDVSFNPALTFYLFAKEKEWSIYTNHLRNLHVVLFSQTSFEVLFIPGPHYSAQINGSVSKFS
jgi:hypothetical protein